jgi:DMSO/TMAO reductase YedYZ molybdopterin-dependent catalytic subunit
MRRPAKKVFQLSLVLLLAALLLTGSFGCGGAKTTTTTTTPADSGATVLTITKGSEVKTYNMAEIMAMTPTEGWGGIMNSSGVISGPYRQKGVLLTELLDSVGGIGENDALRITAKDGYSMTYSYDQIVNGNFTTLDCSSGEEVSHGTLTVILSYEEDGVTLDSDKYGPLRVVILSSNTQVTEGHWWVKRVEQIEIVELEPTWSLHLEGAMVEDIDMNTFESCSAPGCHGASWTDDEGAVWDGIPLWFLVGRVDDDNSHSKESQAFNDALAIAGYEVNVIAADEYSKTFTSEEVKRNNDMIVAFRVDGGPLPEERWPLRLVGPELTKGQMVSQIVTIEVVFP